MKFILFALIYIFFIPVSSVFALNIDEICPIVQSEIENNIKNKKSLKELKRISTEMVEYHFLFRYPELQKNKDLQKTAMNIFNDIMLVSEMNTVCLLSLLSDNSVLFLDEYDFLTLYRDCISKCNAQNFVHIVNNEFYDK